MFMVYRVHIASLSCLLRGGLKDGSESLVYRFQAFDYIKGYLNPLTFTWFYLVLIKLYISMSPCFFPFFGHNDCIQSIYHDKSCDLIIIFIGICYLTLLTQLLKIKSKCIYMVVFQVACFVFFTSNEILHTSEWLKYCHT